MQARRSLFVLLLVSAVAVAEVPPSPDAKKAASLASAYEAVDRAFGKPVEAGLTPGMVWGIVADGVLVHTGTAGFREVTSRARVEPATVFRIASM
ncbi:MAG TPA: serine hydrolase, partial [Myxococcaceae bacterium]|nr:serine hydrolase [Myxococcaceae bacterium]